MSKWREVRLGDYISIKHGYAFKGENITSIENKNILVTPGNFDIGGGFKYTGKKFYDGEIIVDYILEPGDIIVTMTDLSKNADTLGYAALVPKDSNIYLHNQRIGLVKVESEELNENYLYWILRTPWYQRRIANTSSGVNVKHTSPKRIYNYKFNLPDLETQEKIAQVLSSYDELIENNNRRIELLENMAEEIYKEWFVRMRFPGHEEVSFEKGIPEGWEVKKIGELGEVITGKTPSTKNNLYYGNDILFVKTPDMHNNTFINDTEVKLSSLGSKSQINKLLPENSIMVSCIGTGGIVSINSKKAHTNQQINSIILKDIKLREWAYLTLKSMKGTIEAFGSTGATMTNLSKGKFENLKILYPTKKLLLEFNLLNEPIFSKILKLNKQNQNLIKQRDMLLPRLMNGTIEVK